MLVVRWIPLIGLIAPMGLWLMPLTAMGRDLDGHYANSPLKPWFDQLKSRNGACCSNADGYVVEAREHDLDRQLLRRGGDRLRRKLILLTAFSNFRYAICSRRS